MALVKGDARQLPLAANSVDCVVTSPPYWGLRDYGVPGQLGLEPTPEAYVAQIVIVFREVWRVLKPPGVVWLNLGDSYATHRNDHDWLKSGATAKRGWHGGDDLKSKDLCGIPWRVAFALQADGWYLRSDIIWAKPNPMPESVTDRPTKAHEYVFLLSKRERYYYDAAAIAEPALQPVGRKQWTGSQHKACLTGNHSGTLGTNQGDPFRNCRSVWNINTQPYNGAHFATMPEALVTRCILAGCPLGGLVLDPFIGSGTVGAVAEQNGRRWVGVDLAYQHLAAERTAQRGLMFAEVAG